MEGMVMKQYATQACGGEGKEMKLLDSVYDDHIGRY